MSDEDLHAFRKAAHYSVPVGGERFVEKIAKVSGAKVGYAKRGGPKMHKDNGGYYLIPPSPFYRYLAERSVLK